MWLILIHEIGASIMTLSSFVPSIVLRFMWIQSMLSECSHGNVLFMPSCLDMCRWLWQCLPFRCLFSAVKDIWSTVVLDWWWCSLPQLWWLMDRKRCLFVQLWPSFSHGSFPNIPVLDRTGLRNGLHHVVLTVTAYITTRQRIRRNRVS